MILFIEHLLSLIEQLSSLVVLPQFQVILWLLLGLAGAAVFLRFARTQEVPMLVIGLVTAALIYVCFTVVNHASIVWTTTEIAGVGIYGLLALLGWRFSKWWLMLGWMLHPIWDINLHLLHLGAEFTPAWYVLGCASFDLLVAAYIGGTQVGLIDTANHHES